MSSDVPISLWASETFGKPRALEVDGPDYEGEYCFEIKGEQAVLKPLEVDELIAFLTEQRNRHRKFEETK